MGRTIQDVIRDQENEKRKAKGEKADAAAGSTISAGDTAGASRKNAGKDAAAPEFSEPRPTPPGPDAGLTEQAKYQKAVREWEKRKAAAGLTAGKQAEAVK